jgi:hypothetical protein
MVHGIFYNLYRIKEAISPTTFTQHFDFCAFFAQYGVHRIFA